jgi:hypothetical protein
MKKNSGHRGARGVPDPAEARSGRSTKSAYGLAIRQRDGMILRSPTDKSGPTQGKSR